MWRKIYPYLIVFAIGLLIGAGVVYLATRGSGESQRLIESIQAENRELKERLGSIQTAVDSVGAGITSAADEAGDIADGIGGVIAGLDDSIRLVDELAELYRRTVEILESGAGPEPPG